MTQEPCTSADDFVRCIAALKFEGAFNPYAESCDSHDRADAPAVRRRNLRTVLTAAMERGVDSVWIGRDLGYRGGRRTGLALTDEMHLTAHADLFGTRPLSRATKGLPVAERTATVIWAVLESLQRPVFLWNVFPLHPHEPGDPMSNRCHTTEERQACRPLLVWLLRTLRPTSVVAIGRDAHLALSNLEIEARSVRHPSYGGQREFVSGICKIYGVAAPASHH
jgi:uracil-DNA glycosylase